jgi:beta-lactam-binding protein with PASTA domain
MYVIQNELKVGEVTYEKSNLAAGTVIRQSADAQKEIDKYSRIDFVVSGGSNYAGNGTVPPTAGNVPETEPDTEPETEDPDDWEIDFYFPDAEEGTIYTDEDFQ